jgi:para-aminobenzoate synthetase/4-amino-4-deoxychorismate lyase
MTAPFVLLDDARPNGASAARLYREPREIVVARRPNEVAPALARIEALHGEGRDLAGYIAYEAGLALEPKLAGLARGGANGPLLWFGAFDGYQTIPPSEVAQWLAHNADSTTAAIGPLTPRVSAGAYAAAFARLHEAILAGDIYQANLTIPLTGSWRGDPLALYGALRATAQAGYGGIVHDGSHWLLSCSPELFLALQDGDATVKPMKGTRRRGRDAAEDAALAAELAASPKDRAENLMIVDLMRNDLSRVAEAGSVRVEQAFTIESYPTVHQMVSTIRAQIAPQRRRCRPRFVPWRVDHRHAQDPRNGTDRRGRARYSRALLRRDRPDRCLWRHRVQCGNPHLASVARRERFWPSGPRRRVGDRRGFGEHVRMARVLGQRGFRARVYS